jgi:UDP-glucose 4-epimerase
MGERRPGDPAKVVASSTKAQKLLGWKPKASLEEIIQTAWKWEIAEKERRKK